MECGTCVDSLDNHAISARSGFAVWGGEAFKRPNFRHQAESVHLIPVFSLEAYDLPRRRGQ